ncbi:MULTISPECIES: medium-chain fatty-acid--CoA ligase [Bacillus]|uniref:medium-chain fatty-acid--CoA ligase n=1 Tax=Bacillus TaxID=1386 RepID=UPI0002DE461B|nr:MULTISPECIES: medium-chain fatty-acid--CoA ligase [Bacillus]
MSLGMKISEFQKREYRKKGLWGDATLADYWKMSLLKFPEKVAIVDLQGDSYTYSEIDDAANRLAHFFIQKGVEPGDFISVQLPDWAEFLIIYVACLKTGAVINPVLPNARELELTYILNKCQSKMLFVPCWFRKCDYTNMIKSLSKQVTSLKEIIVVEKGREIKEEKESITYASIIQNYPALNKEIRSNADDLAAVLFTSGTEGHPKGVMLTHNNIIASERTFTNYLDINDFDVILMPVPVAHASCFHHGVTAAFMLGAKCVLLDIYKPHLCLELIERERCTCGFGSTSIVYDLLRTLPKGNYDISSLRFFMCGGAPIPRHMVKQGIKAGFNVIGVYGSTESVPHTATSPNDTSEKIIQTDGKALPGIEIKVVDEARNSVPTGFQGEEASRGPNVFVGYLREPEMTDKVLDDEGWYYSGDLCTMDEDGYIRINGRKKDIIIRGGENISSVEVEDILQQHPNVYEVAVVAMPDPRLGERACAYVVLNNPAIPFTLEDVKVFFDKMHVAKFKYPERVELVDRLPRTGSCCKVKKYILREDIKKKLKKQIYIH